MIDTAGGRDNLLEISGWSVPNLFVIGGNPMDGVIRTRDVLAHPIAAIRCLGWRIFFKAVVPWRHQTLLSLLQEDNYFGDTDWKVPELFERAIAVELQARRIYAAFARVFVGSQTAARFFEILARQEQEHADLLQVCQTIARHGGWKAERFAAWHDVLPRLEQRMGAMEASLRGIGSLDDALQLVVQIESSEINEVFLGVVAATDRAFVRKLTAYRNAIDLHLAYLCRRMSELAPGLTDACQRLRGQFYRP